MTETGYPLSPTLFNLALQKVIQSIKMVPSGIKIGKEQMNILAYVDDIVLSRKNEIEIRKLFVEMENIARKLGIQINQEKTKYVKKLQLRLKNTIRDETLTYASETWILTKRDRKQMNIFERKVYRRILGPAYDNEKENWRILTNKEIHAIVRKPTITEKIRLNRLPVFYIFPSYTTIYIKITQLRVKI